MVGLMVTSSKRTYAILTTQSPCPCSRPPLTHISTGDTQTQFGLSFCGVPVSWCTQGLFEPSVRFWKEWGLILNTNLPLLPSCWGFSFALGCRVSPQQPLQCLLSCWGFSDIERGVSLLGCSLLQCHASATLNTALIYH